MSSKPVIIVTGAAGGIGSETVRILLEECNARVVGLDIVPGRLAVQRESFPQDLEIVIGDIIDPATSRKAVKAALDRFGEIDGLCLLAGVFGPCYRLDNSSMDQWTRAIQINVLSHLHMLGAILPELRKTKGKIVAATSGAGHSALFAGWGCYGISKAAVAFEIKQLHLEEPDVISVGISPGLCDTAMVGSLKAGRMEGQTAEDLAKYHAFVGQIELISPTIAGDAYAKTVTLAGQELGGQVVDYNDARLPIAESAKAKSGSGTANGDALTDYSKFTK